MGTNKKVRVAVLGFGNVARALIRHLLDPTTRRILDAASIQLTIVGIATGTRGAVIDSDGIDLRKLAEIGTGGLDALTGATRTLDALQLIDTVAADVVVEATPATDDGNPAAARIERAIRRGLSVVAANKSPIAWQGDWLRGLAAAKGVELRFGATALAARHFFGRLTGVRRIEAVFNATSNAVLTEMFENGVPFQEALRRAQGMGIAEADPTRDIGGHDTRDKLAIVANELMGRFVPPDEIPTVGIQRVTLECLQRAAADGRWIHLLGEARVDVSGRIRATVGPTEVSDPFLAQMRGTEMGLRVETAGSTVETKTSIGSGPGAVRATAEAILEDLVAVAAAMR